MKFNLCGIWCSAGLSLAQEYTSSRLEEEDYETIWPKDIVLVKEDDFQRKHMILRGEAHADVPSPGYDQWI